MTEETLEPGRKPKQIRRNRIRELTSRKTVGFRKQIKTNERGQAATSKKVEFFKIIFWRRFNKS